MVATSDALPRRVPNVARKTSNCSHRYRRVAAEPPHTVADGATVTGRPPTPGNKDQGTA